MKILIYTTKSPFTGNSVGGAETSLRLIAEEFVNRGHEVTFISKSRQKFFSGFVKQVDGINVIHYPDLKSIQVANRPVIPSIILRFVDSFFLSLILKIEGLKNYDIVHTFYELSFLKKIIQLRKKNNYKYKIVMRMAGLYWSDNISADPQQKKVYQEIFNEVDSINYISNGLKLMTEKAVKEVGLKYEPNCTFTGDIGVRLNERLPNWNKNRIYDQNPLNIILATRFSSRSKRQDLLIEAVKIMENPSGFRIKMIGEGESKEEIKRLISNFGLDEIIEVLPFQPQDKLWAMMSDSHLLCHPTDDEGLGKIIIESMAIGLPVLASNVPPLNNYITDGENGFLADNEPEAWKNKLEDIVAHKEELQKVSENGKTFACNKYDSKQNIKIYEKEFLSLLSEENKE